MAKASPLQANFNSGEIDPRMVGRVDFDRLRSALVVCKNATPRVTGSWTRRPGTYLCDEVKDSTKATRIVRFKFSTLQAFAIEFGHQYVRFKKNRAPVYDLALTITAATQGNPVVLTYQIPTDAGVDADVDLAANTLTVPSNTSKWITGLDVVFTLSSGTITGLVSGTTYFIIRVSATLVKLATTRDNAFSGTAIDFTAKAAPVWTITRIVSNGEHLDVAGVVGMTQLNGRRFKAANVNAAANTVELQTVDGVTVNGAAFTAYVSGGTASRVYTLATPYLEVDLFRLKFTQSADTLYIWHPDYPERTLVRTTDSSWTIASTVLIDGPYLGVNTTATTLTPSAFAPGAGVTLTASAVTGINRDTGFQTTDVGRLIRIRATGIWGYVLITARTSTTVVTVTIINTLTDIAAKVVWRMGLYSDTTGYPACGTFYGDRIYRGGCPEMPDRLDGSNVGDYLNMATTATDGTVTAAHAVSFRLNSEDVQTIRWMSGTGNGLAVGTFDGEWLVTPSTNQEAITPTNISARQSTPYGSADLQPARVGTALIFVEAGGRRVREMNYLYYENVLQSPDMTVLAEHITKGDYDPANPHAGLSTVARSGIVELAFQKKTVPLVWAVRKDGVLLGLTYSKDEKVMGWHRHSLGGFSNVGKTAPAEVESCCVIPASDGSYDELWLVVRRYINGRSVRLIEFLAPHWEQGNAQQTAYFVDGGLTYNGAPTTTLTGLYHLAGETVQILADGATQPDVVVSATGTVTLTAAASVVHVGYTYPSDGQCLRFDVGSEDGTAQGKTQRAHRVVFRLYETLGLQVGPSFTQLLDLPFRSAADQMGVATPLFTGDKDDFSWDGNYTTEHYVCWRCQSPLPGEVLAVMPLIHTQDR